MAAPRKKATPKPSKRTEDAGRNCPPDVLKKVIARAVASRNEIKELTAESGVARKRDIERYSLNRKALGDVIRMAGMDEAKRLDYFRSLFLYAMMAEFFAQTDAFDDIRTVVAEVFNLVPADGQPSQAEENSERLRQGISELDEFDRLAPVQ